MSFGILLHFIIYYYSYMLRLLIISSFIDVFEIWVLLPSNSYCFKTVDLWEAYEQL